MGFKRNVGLFGLLRAFGVASLRNLRDDPLNTYSLPFCSSGLLDSSKALGKPLVEPKTLGWEHSKRILEIVFENLGVV
jgi:hypothetical protein